MTAHSEVGQVSNPGTSRAARLAGMDALILVALVVIGWFTVVDGRPNGTDPVLPAIARLGGFVLAGWVAVGLLRLVAGLRTLVAAQVEATARLASTVDRLVETLQRAPSPVSSGPNAPPASPPAPPSRAIGSDSRTMARAEIHVAIRQGQWAQAEGLIQAYTDVQGDDDAAVRLAGELAAAKQSAAAALRDRIDAAREANDPERVLEAREALAPLLAPEVARAHDRDLARWFMGLIQKRLRSGVITVDVAVLASRVAEAFAATPEGASLRAALPTLRRSVGLCSRCGNPYTGIADACPSCLATSSFPAFVPAGVSPASHGDLSRPAGTAPSEAIAPEPE